MSHTKAQTDSLRQALAVVLDHVAATPGGAFDEADLVHGVVEEFANGANLWGPLLSVPGLPAPVTAPIPGHGDKRPTHVAIRGLGAEIESAHAEFRKTLAEIVDGRVSRANRDQVTAQRLRIIQVGKHYLPESLAAALAFVMDLLLDETKGYGADMRACQLEGCHRFFFISSRPRDPGKENVGARPDKYCSPEHARKAHNKVKSEWTKNNRKRLKERVAAGKLKVKRRHK